MQNIKAKDIEGLKEGLKHPKSISDNDIKQCKKERSNFGNGGIGRRKKGCAKIKQACIDSGFKQGKWLKGYGLWRDCIHPVMQGVEESEIYGLKEGLKHPESISADDIAQCKNSKPNFGSGLIGRTSKDYCRIIKNTCEDAGFKSGKWKNGFGLWSDCINPLVQGVPSSEIKGFKQSLKIPTSISQEEVALCQQSNEKFGTGKIGRGQ
jgi:hypothetical protein